MSTNGVEKRPTFEKPGPLTELTGRIRQSSSRGTASSAAGEVASKRPSIKQPLSSRGIDSSSATSKLIPAPQPSASRPISTNRHETGKNDKTPQRNVGGYRLRSGSAFKTSSNRMSPADSDYAEATNSGTGRGVREIQMDMGNVQLEDRRVSGGTTPGSNTRGTSARRGKQSDDWGWADDDDYIVTGPLQAGKALTALRVQEVSTPKIPIAVTTAKDLGTIVSMYGTLTQSFCGPTDVIKDSSAHSRKIASPTASVWVVRYVDYTSKYGLGFLLNTGSAGVHFNDSTKIVLSPDNTTFQYIERKRRLSGAATGEHSCVTHAVASYPPELHKKVTLLRHFSNYLVEQERQDKPLASDPKSFVVKAKEFNNDPVQYFPSGAGAKIDQVDELVYLKKWVRTRHAILFRLSNKTVQVVFFDRRYCTFT